MNRYMQPIAVDFVYEPGNVQALRCPLRRAGEEEEEGNRAGESCNMTTPIINDIH